MKCRRILVTGQVQGVGFRITARSIAERLGLAGCVRNLSDGRVELMVQGPDAVVESLIDELGERFHMTDIQDGHVDAAVVFDRFSVVA